MHAGAKQLTAKDGSVEQEPGAGVSGVVHGHHVAVGAPDWLASRGVAGAPPLLPAGGPQVCAAACGTSCGWLCLVPLLA